MTTNLIKKLHRSRTTVAMTAVAGVAAGLISAGLGSTVGGGVAVVRHGNRFGFVSLMSGRSAKPDGTLRTLAVPAAERLGWQLA